MAKNKLTRAEKERVPLNEDLKIRVLNVKKRLPKSGVTSLFFHYFGESFRETIKNKSRLNNVLQTRVTDETITERLEQLADLLENPQASKKTISN